VKPQFSILLSYFVGIKLLIFFLHRSSNDVLRQVRRRSECGRLLLLDRASIRWNPPSSMADIYAAEHLRLQLQPLPRSGRNMHSSLYRNFRGWTSFPYRYWHICSYRLRRRPRLATVCGRWDTARTSSTARSTSRCRFHSLGSLRCQPTRSSPWLIYSAGSDRSINWCCSQFFLSFSTNMLVLSLSWTNICEIMYAECALPKH